jgi:hypothetical protein
MRKLYANIFQINTTPSSTYLSTKSVEDVMAWASPKCVNNVQIIMGVTNFYRRFILHFAFVCKPITDTLKLKGKIFIRGTAQENAFVNLKIAFTSGPILKHFDPPQPIQI